MTTIRDALTALARLAEEIGDDVDTRIVLDFLGVTDTTTTWARFGELRYHVKQQYDLAGGLIGPDGISEDFAHGPNRSEAATNEAADRVESALDELLATALSEAA